MDQNKRKERYRQDGKRRVEQPGQGKKPGNITTTVLTCC